MYVEQKLCFECYPVFLDLTYLLSLALMIVEPFGTFEKEMLPNIIFLLLVEKLVTIKM